MPAIGRRAGRIAPTNLFHDDRIPEIGRAEDNARLAREALRAGDYARARELVAESTRCATLARIRITHQRERLEAIHRDG